MTPITSVAQAREIVARLSRHFMIPPPTVVQSTGRQSRYYGLRRELRLSPDTWSGLTLATLHEFAHHVTREKEGPKHGHDAIFYRHLKAVIVAYGGGLATLRAYDWHNEYQTLWAYASREGFTRRAWFKQERRAAQDAAAVASGQPRLHAGMRVSFTSSKGRQHLTGRIGIEPTRGCRVRVLVDGMAPGRFWMVPPHMLTVLPGPEASTVTPAAIAEFERLAAGLVAARAASRAQALPLTPATTCCDDDDDDHDEEDEDDARPK